MQYEIQEVRELTRMKMRYLRRPGMVGDEAIAWTSGRVLRKETGDSQ
jgi:hypothetical protein